jgi:hypothetical protein
MAEVISSKADPKTAQCVRDGQSLGSDLAAAGGAYSQAAQQLLVDMVNDIAQVLKNIGAVKS